MSTLSRRREPLRLPSLDEAKVGSVLAVLLVGGRYVMQLRDNRPGIPDPGVWALFGGRIEPGETPRAALVREIQEELDICLPDCRFLGRLEYDHEGTAAGCPYWVFEADITPFWGRHRLTEGQDAACFLFEEIQGLTIPPMVRRLLERHYSEKMLLDRYTNGLCCR